jgi:hypothetical protein
MRVFALHKKTCHRVAKQEVVLAPQTNLFSQDVCVLYMKKTCPFVLQANMLDVQSVSDVYI